MKLEGADEQRSSDSAIKREHHAADIKSERSGAASSFEDAAARSGAAAHSARPAAPASSGLKVEDEPGHSDVVAALAATAAAASAPVRTSQSATAPSAAPSVVPVSQQTINYGASGLLSTAANTVNGVEMKYAEPIEARVPDQEWRLYVFKDKKPQGRSFSSAGHLPTSLPRCAHAAAV